MTFDTDTWDGQGPEPAPKAAGAAPQPPEEAPSFRTVRRGFDPEAVDRFVAQTATATTAWREQVRKAREEGPDRGDEDDAGTTKGRSAEIGDELTSVAERGAASMVEEAKNRAAAIRADAEERAEGIVAEATAEAKRVTDEAQRFADGSKEQADRSLADVAERRQRMLDGLRQVQERLTDLLPELGDEPPPA